ncbi:hypothetical protein LCGC14_1941940 [marine sediment metagenome]|uniref:Uncharacterized protein n=1 Tax=marine sediment metagenome TaxID=412755 RepID=A0A0F9G8J5_9ZZZZ
MEYRPPFWENPYFDNGEVPNIPEEVIPSLRTMLHRAWEGGASCMREHILSLLKEKAPSSVVIDILSGYECKR